MFATGPSINTRLLVAIVLSFTLLAIDQHSSRLANLRAGLSFIVYPILYAVDLPSKFFAEISESAFTFSELTAENKRLKEQQFISDSKLLKFEALEKENIRLRSLLDSSYKIGEQMLVAEILSVNLAPFDHVVLVDKGSRFGLHDKQPVFDTQGVVGQVIRTLPLSSEIMLITDPNHAIPVQVNRNGLRTIAVGSGQLNRLILPFLPNNADIKPGDLLITSGLGGTFPQGYPVAVVNSFEVQPHKPFALIVATPKAALDKIREVLIVWSDSKSVPLNLPPAGIPSVMSTPVASESSINSPVIAPKVAGESSAGRTKPADATIRPAEPVSEVPPESVAEPESPALTGADKGVEPSATFSRESVSQDSVSDSRNAVNAGEKSEADAAEISKLMPEVRLEQEHKPEVDEGE